MRGYSKFIDEISIKSLFKMDFKNSREFERKYILISLQRGRLFNWIIFIASFYSFYADFIFYKNNNINVLYRKTLIVIHIIVFISSMIYIIIFKLLESKERYRASLIAKAAVISDIFLGIFSAAVTSLNSQRFSGNIDAYIITVLVVVLIIPIYPKAMFWIYSLNHTFFIIGLSFFCENKEKAIINQLNSTTTVIASFVLFFVLYRYNVKNFLNDERIKEDKLTFQKLFEMNPFPLFISRLKDGKIQDANNKAKAFYNITKDQVDTLNHKDLYKNTTDLELILDMLQKNGQFRDYVVEHKTFSGQSKWVIVNYELIDYFGEKSILTGIADITEIKRMENELTTHASIDALTGVLNRRIGMDITKRKLERLQNENDEFAICFVDIDKLKMVNDNFGHNEGDYLIIEICKAIKEEIQANDVIFRYGGDEFIILFDNKSEYEINKICGRIRDRFKDLNKNKCKPYFINASLGIFLYKSEMNLNIEQIIELADKEMYKNKLENGRKFV